MNLIKSIQLFLFLFLLIISCHTKCIDQSNEETDFLIQEHIDCNVSTRFVGKSLEHFWESTGFCPPDPHDESSDYMLSDDMHQNIALIGSLPHNGIKQIRVHFLLKLITAENKSNGIQYNFTLLDQFLTQLKSFGLKPGFEIMGNPSNIFNDFENKTQVYLWKDLVKQLVTRYINMFGIDYIKTWNFESWNEPSIEFKQHFNDNIKVTPKGFLNYYDACSQALKEVDESLILGGPGDHWPSNTKNGPFVIDLVKHYINGTNYFTGNKSDIKLDFLSLHEKGNQGNSSYIDFLENRALNDIQNEFPSLKSVPFVENEGDPENRTWRADNRYAATMVQVLARRVLHYNHTNKLLLYGFDNGFLSLYPFQFTQRTLLARFQMNNTVPHYTQFVRKPAFIAMGLLSKLGNHLIEFKTNCSDNLIFNVMATAFKESDDTRPTDYSILLVNSADTIISNKNTSIRFNFLFDQDSLTTTQWKWSQYMMDNNRTNPFRKWTENNCPPFPSEQLFADMREQEEPFIENNSENLILTDNRWNHTFKMAFPGLSLIQICRKTSNSPKKLDNFRVVYRTDSSVLLRWSASELRCLKTYELEFSKNKSFEKFEILNKKDFIFPSFQHMSDQTIAGFYRIRVIDFWDRKSDFTVISI